MNHQGAIVTRPLLMPSMVIMLLASACTTESTGRHPAGAQQRAIGTLALALTVADGSEVTSVTYAIRSQGRDVRTGAIAVGAHGGASVTVSNVEAGSGYVALLRATRTTGSDCYGESAPFEVVAQQTTQVAVVVSCADVADRDENTAVAIDVDFAAPTGDKVNSITIDGMPLDTTRTYRVTVNSFLATGGDGFVVLNSGSDRVGGEVDVDGLETYLRVNNPIAPPAFGRITRVN